MPTGDFPCPTCGQYWCSGHWVQPEQWIPYTPLYPSITTGSLGIGRLHKDDIEAIAKRVVELLAEKLK